MGADHIRYSGSPLKYSFDEHAQKKSFTIIDMDTTGKVDISTIPVEAKRDVVILEGYFEDLLNNTALQTKHKMCIRDRHDAIVFNQHFHARDA